MALLSSVAVKVPVESAAAAPSPDRSAVIAEEQLQHVQLLNSTIEQIFLFTLNKYSVLGGPQQQLVFLSSLAEIIGKS
jgi:hypothetical protein